MRGWLRGKKESREDSPAWLKVFLAFWLVVGLACGAVTVFSGRFVPVGFAPDVAQLACLQFSGVPYRVNGQLVEPPAVTRKSGKVETVVPASIQGQPTEVRARDRKHFCLNAGHRFSSP
ncbi:hypothetical protein [Deinococcus phoenicis]|nr:hypothetical protein [Deinococcus phoenicis]